MRSASSKRRQKRTAMSAKQHPDTFKSAMRALLILDAVERSSGGKQLAELSSELGLDKATALRILQTLVAERVLVRDAGTGRYSRDLTSWTYFSEFLRPALSLMSSVQAILDDLSESTESTCLLVLPALEGRGALVPMHSLPKVSLYYDRNRAPEKTPLHAAAGGKCYLADLPKEQLDRYLGSELERSTQNTITSPSALRRELARVRRQGYALNRSETHEGVSGIAVPVRGPTGAVVGGLALGFAGSDVAQREGKAFVPVLAEATQQLSDMMTYQSWLRRVEQNQPQEMGALSPWGAPDPRVEDDGVPRVRTVARMVRLTAFLFTQPEGVSLGEVAETRMLGKSTAWRLLSTLASAGVLWQDAPNKRYRISPLFWLARATDLRSAASRADAVTRLLKEVSDALGETVALGLPDSEERYAVTYQFALPDRPICWRVGYGPPAPLHTTAGGKCYLAAQSKLAVADYIRRGLPALTDMSITSPEQLRRELEQVRREGYALNREEMERGMEALAVPVTDAGGTTAGAVVVCSVTTELTPARIRQWLPLLRRTAAVLSRLLVPGWRGELEGQGSAGAGESPGARTT
jgi:DNA-binding IclR family transcriptional regulator